MSASVSKNMDLGFGIWDLGFGIWDLGFGIWNLGFGIWDLGFGIWDLGFGIWDLGFGIWDLGIKKPVSGTGFLEFIAYYARAVAPAERALRTFAA